MLHICGKVEARFAVSLSELDAWITSIRRDQTSFRKSAGKIEWG